MPSLPTGERGLKFMQYTGLKDKNGVAPHGGAWIEILSSIKPCLSGITSLPTGERGLKFSGILMILLISLSLPTGERGLKSLRLPYYLPLAVSLPTGERGLK